MKKVISILLALFMLGALSAGCTKQSEGPAKETTAAQTAVKTEAPVKKTATVKFFSTIGAYKELLEAETANWNATVGKEKGITIEMESNIDNAVQARKLLLESGNAPDIMNVDTTTIIGGWCLALDDIAEVQDTLDLYRDSLAIGVNVFGGKIYTAPQEMLPIKMVYNKDLFIKNKIVDANGNAKPPKTMDEMVEYARIITKNGNNKEYGFGYTFGWSSCLRRLNLKTAIASTGTSWFNNNTGKYDFKPFEPTFKAIKQMFDDGSVFPGYETLSIDALRAQFAEGNVGMIGAPQYDIAVYNTQFPAKCDWGVCDYPQYTADPGYKGVCIVRGGAAISKSVKEENMWAITEFWNFLNSVEFNAKLFASGSIMPASQVIIDYAYSKNMKIADLKNLKEMSVLDNYGPMPSYPDAALALEGDPYPLVFQQYVLGKVSLEEMVEDLNKRYNAAYEQGKKDKNIDVSLYEYSVDLKR